MDTNSFAKYDHIYDMHCHIVPGVDDGPDTVEEAIELLRSIYDSGVRRLVLTPHFRKEMFEAPADKVFSQYLTLKAKAISEFPDLQMLLGCEFHAHMDMEEAFSSRPHIKMADSDYLLLEFSSLHNLSYIKERTCAVLAHGFKPIIAHAERYPALNKDINSIPELKYLGAFIQVNADSVLGKDGFGVKRFVWKLINADLVDFIGSDAHNLTDRPSRLAECAKLVEKKMGEDYTYKIFNENPSVFFNNSLFG